MYRWSLTGRMTKAIVISTTSPIWNAPGLIMQYLNSANVIDVNLLRVYVHAPPMFQCS